MCKSLTKIFFARRNRIMAGVIVFDMLYIPPQPKKVASWVICELEHPQVYIHRVNKCFPLPLAGKFLFSGVENWRLDIRSFLKLERNKIGMLGKHMQLNFSSISQKWDKLCNCIKMKENSIIFKDWVIIGEDRSPFPQKTINFIEWNS